MSTEFTAPRFGVTPRQAWSMAGMLGLVAVASAVFLLRGIDQATYAQPNFLLPVIFYAGATAVHLGASVFLFVRYVASKARAALVVGIALLLSAGSWGSWLVAAWEEYHAQSFLPIINIAGLPAGALSLGLAAALVLCGADAYRVPTARALRRRYLILAAAMIIAAVFTLPEFIGLYFSQEATADPTTGFSVAAVLLGMILGVIAITMGSMDPRGRGWMLAAGIVRILFIFPFNFPAGLLAAVLACVAGVRAGRNEQARRDRS
ncbi:hypothetical protein [Corynebacterium sp.]|uniref:hypothetical protein n=1 Tax=Corynebacterium sp. TaxID=1720 RepID=UPI0026DBD868|nr:hypothetical protein [Corynebacterium sp.]MDO5032893.1 hypothetical protein [Corynebacterium sp.]